MNQETCLYHHGVKGMKWGHRKQRVLKGPSRGTSRKKFLTKQRKEKLKTAAAIGGTLAIGLGAAIVSSEMKRSAEFSKISSSMINENRRNIENIVSQYNNLKKLF